MKKAAAEAIRHSAESLGTEGDFESGDEGSQVMGLLKIIDMAEGMGDEASRLSRRRGSSEDLRQQLEAIVRNDPLDKTASASRLSTEQYTTSPLVRPKLTRPNAMVHQRQGSTDPGVTTLAQVTPEPFGSPSAPEMPRRSVLDSIM